MGKLNVINDGEEKTALYLVCEKNNLDTFKRLLANEKSGIKSINKVNKKKKLYYILQLKKDILNSLKS